VERRLKGFMTGRLPKKRDGNRLETADRIEGENRRRLKRLAYKAVGRNVVAVVES
jgi:hypothetical protein